MIDSKKLLFFEDSKEKNRLFNVDEKTFQLSEN